MISSAAVRSVSLYRQGLIPQWRASRSNSRVRSMTIGARSGPRSGNGRLASRSKVVNANHVSAKYLRLWEAFGQKEHCTKHEDLRSHCIPPLAVFGSL